MAMAKVYVRLIKAGRRTIDEVPDNLREIVEELLAGEE